LVEARTELIASARELAESEAKTAEEVELLIEQMDLFGESAKRVDEAVTKLTPSLDDAGKSMEGVGNAAAAAEPKIESLADTVAEKASFMDDALSNVFNSAADALTEFITTGKLDFKSLIDDMLKQITKLALDNLFSGLFGGGGGGLFGGGGGGGGLGGLFSGIGSLFGFAHGGGFNVGGIPGVDNNLLSINNRPVAKVSRGERIEVIPQGGSFGRAVNVNMTVVTPNAESFQRSSGQIQARIQSGLSRASRRNN